MLARRAKASGRKAPPFATVVTDLTSCHPTWFHRGVDRCFVPTEEVAALARRVGLTNAQIVQHGLPIRPAFAAPLPPRPALRQKLGLAPQGSVVLLMGGGEGMGLLEPTALALAEALPPSAQIVVVCGRNAALASRLAARQWPCRLVAKGFVSNIDEWMGASDVVITKAGPGTIAEALIRGVPLLLNGAIPCQEEGNVPFVVEVRSACAPCTLACLLTRAFPATRRTGWASSTQSPRRLRRRWRPGSVPPRTSWRRWRPRLRRWAAQTQPSASCATWRTCAQCTPGRSRPEGGCVAGCGRRLAKC